MYRFRKFTALSLLSALPFVAFSLERTDLLPGQAKTFVRISNTVNFWEEVQKSSLGKLWADQQFQDFIGNPDAETWQEIFFSGQEADPQNQVLMDQLKMLTGEVIIAFDAEMEDPYIIAAMTEEDFLRSLELDEQLLNVTEDAFEIVKSTFQDVEIIKHIENPGSGAERFSWQTHVGSTFILGYTKEWVEQNVVRLKKEEITEPAGNPVMNLNLPLTPLIEEALSEGEEGVTERAMLEALGLFSIENFACRIELQDSQMIVDNNLSISDLNRGIFALLNTEPSDLPTVTFIPEDIATLEVGRFDLMNLWQEVPVFLADAAPEAKPQFDMILAMLQQQSGISIEQDLIANLGKKYVAFSTVDGELQESVIAIELEDGMAFRSGLETAMAAPGLQPYIATGLDLSVFLDHTIYSLKNELPEEKMGIALTGDYLLYGTYTGIQQVIRSESSEAAENQSFERSELVQGLRRYISDDAFGFSAIDWKKNMSVMMAEFNQPEYIYMIQQKWAQSGSALPPPDFSKLPPADHIAQYFNISYQYVEARGNGLHQKIILKY